MSAITIDLLKNAVNQYIPPGTEARSNAEFILSLAENGDITIDDANRDLCDLHQSICLNALITSSGDTATNTGVFCKCTSSGAVIAVAGGNNVVHSTEFLKCLAARGKSSDDYSFTPTGKAADCMPLPSEGIANECKQALLGSLTSCG